MRVIIDTDIGTDFDDAAALALAMKADRVRIEGVTTVHGDTALRARLAKQLLRLGGRGDVPVYAGLERTLLGNRDRAWTGHEGEGVLRPNEGDYDAGNAVEFIIRTIMDHPGEITLVTIGPLTNAAAAIITEPRVVTHVKEIVAMGGYAGIGAVPDNVDPYDHNIICDPEAASVVFASGAPITMVGLDVTYRSGIRREQFVRHWTREDPLHSALFQLMDRWLAHRATFKPKLDKDLPFMHDALAMAVLLDRSVVRTMPMKVSVEYGPQQGSGKTVAVPDEEGTVQVCYDLDFERFQELYFSVVGSR